MLTEAGFDLSIHKLKEKKPQKPVIVDVLNLKEQNNLPTRNQKAEFPLIVWYSGGSLSEYIHGDSGDVFGCSVFKQLVSVMCMIKKDSSVSSAEL